MKNQSAFLTSSTVRQWIASLKVEEFLAGKSKHRSPQRSRAAHAVGTESVASDTAISPSHYATSTGEDYEEFLKLMQQGTRPFRRPGVSVKDEFEMWLAARANGRTANASRRRSA